MFIIFAKLNIEHANNDYSCWKLQIYTYICHYLAFYFIIVLFSIEI